MENTARSQRTRDAAIQAALTIIDRDGPSRLTIDAIARESGISKGGILHQFRTKEAVLTALMEHQIEQSEALFRSTLAQLPAARTGPVLEAQILTLQAAANHPKSTTLALAGTMAENADLLAALREKEGQRVAMMKSEAADVRTAMVRWLAAKGLALSAILGLCPLPEAEQRALFAYLADETRWPQPATPVAAGEVTPMTATKPARKVSKPCAAVAAKAPTKAARR